MQNAIWFSRHTPTPEQLAEIETMGFTLVSLDAGTDLGRRSINTISDLENVFADLDALIREAEALAVFGVFPTPLFSMFNGDWTVGTPCFASWNVQRTQEGGAPTFTHKQWVRVGSL